MELETESESDGGMQLDGVSLYSSDAGERGQFESEIDWDIQTHPETRSDTDTFAHRATDPTTAVYNQTGQDQIMQVPSEYEKDTRMRTHLRDDKHAALCVLQDREMLVTYALAANETIPQTRRRFMAKYLAPNDSERAEELYAPRFWIPGDGSGGEGSLVRGRYRDVIGGVDEHGWCKPGYLKRMGEKGSGGFSGANSPRRVSGVRLSGSGRSSGRSSLGRDEEDL